jgi:cystathionine gamma-synthase
MPDAASTQDTEPLRTRMPGSGLATRALHEGLEVDARTGAIAPGVSMSVNNLFAPGEAAFSADGVDDIASLPFLYARWSNPTVQQLEQRLAALEGAEDALATATGVAAIAAVFFTLLKAGDHLIVSDVCYAGAHELACKLLPDYGIEVSAVNLSDLTAVAAALRPNTRLIHAETPCNPLLRLSDLAALAHLAHQHGAFLSVDSTLATPVATQPLAHGADLVVHSLTKFINGHGDALGGCVIGRKALVARLRARAGVYLGATLSAHNAWLIQRGIDTLAARMHTACHSAGRIARFLSTHPAVRAVTYPGLPSHPQHALACRQMAVFGAVITFQVDDAPAMAQQLAQRLKYIHYAFSLGHQRSLVVLLETEALMRSTYGLQGEALADYRRYAGAGVFRLSIGLEATEDLIADLHQALAVDEAPASLSSTG